MNLQIKQHLVLINPTSKRIKLDNGSPQPLCAQWLGRFLFISMKEASFISVVLTVVGIGCGTLIIK